MILDKLVKLSRQFPQLSIITEPIQSFAESSIQQVSKSKKFSMAPVERKRLRPDRVPKPRKRQRADLSDGASKQQIAETNVVSLNTLPWTEVRLPDRFEDAEGFFGLEEIEDVEVVRDTNLEKLEYRVGMGSKVDFISCPA